MSLDRALRFVSAMLLACLLLAGGQALAQPPAGKGGLPFDHATTGFALTGQHAQARCEACHVQGTFRGTPRDCVTCHRAGSQFDTTKLPARHIPTNQACDVCHRTANWTGVVFTHRGVAAGSCATCHTGVAATGKAAGHVPTTKSCDVCHTTLAWRPAGYPHDASMAGRCSSCHNGTTATGKGATHIPDNRQCDTCHTSTTSFTVATMNHTGLAGQDRKSVV